MYNNGQAPTGGQTNNGNININIQSGNQGYAPQEVKIVLNDQGQQPPQQQGFNPESYLSQAENQYVQSGGLNQNYNNQYGKSQQPSYGYNNQAPVYNPNSNFDPNADSEPPRYTTNDRQGKYAVPLQHKNESMFDCNCDGVRCTCSDFGCNISPERQENAKSVLLYFHAIVTLVLLIMLMVYHFGDKAYSLSDISGAFAHMAESNDLDPVLAVQYSDCSASGYRAQVLGEWPGTSFGCNCGIYLHSGSCTKKEKYCLDIWSRSPFNYYQWRDGSNNLCFKRAVLGTDYYKSATGCYMGGIECSPGFCYTGGSCPVSSVSVVNSATPEYVAFGSQILNVSRTSGQQPMSKIAISYFGMPCFDYDKHLTTGSYYTLWYISASGCSKHDRDTTAYSLDSTSESAVITANGAPTKVSSLPNYWSLSSRVTLALYGQSRLQTRVTSTCLNIESSYLKSSSAASGSLDTLVSVASIVGIIFHVILFILCGLLFFSKSGSEAHQVSIPLLTLEFLLWIICGPLAVSYSNKLKANETYLNTLKGCYYNSVASSSIDGYSEVVNIVARNLEGYCMAIFAMSTITFLFVAAKPLYAGIADKIRHC